MKTLIVHLGPHKTGSTSIQRFLREHFSSSAQHEDQPFYYEGRAVNDLARSFGSKNWQAALDASLDLRSELADIDAATIVLSNEDLSGGLVGRGATRRIYPRLFDQIRLIDTALQDSFRISYFFVRRDEADWLKSVYNQNLKIRRVAGNFEAFGRWIRGAHEWDEILSKPRAKLKGRFIEIPYSADPDDNVVIRFQRAALPDLTVKDSAMTTYWDNAAPTPESLALLEAASTAKASSHARRVMRDFAVPDDASRQPVTGFSESQVPFDYTPVATTPDRFHGATWPPRLSRDPRIPDALAPLWTRAKDRVKQEDQPNLMPDMFVDFSAMRHEMTTGEDVFPGKGREDMRHQVRILTYRMRGLPILCFHTALAISYLRRATPHTDHARAIFHRLWESEYPILLATLPTRWLISTLQTFMDHGTTEAQRLIGTAGYFLSNTLKAYEAERALEGLAPDAIYPDTTPTTTNGFPGLDRFHLGHTDLMLNTMAMLLEVSTRDATAGRVLQEFILRLKSANSVFSRMDSSRLHHGIDAPGFLNCWSYFDPPRRPKA